LLISDALGEGYGQEGCARSGGLQNNKKAQNLMGKEGVLKIVFSE
jgi:hypothetical protein